jgi:hypothetical protein
MNYGYINYQSTLSIRFISDLTLKNIYLEQQHIHDLHVYLAIHDCGWFSTSDTANVEHRVMITWIMLDEQDIVAHKIMR